MNQYKALMAGFAAVIGGGGLAAYTGMFSNTPVVVEEKASTNSQPAAAMGTTPAEPSAPAPSTPATTEIAKADPAATEPIKAPEANAVASEPAAAAAPALAPTFDVLRVEPNGSVLIAGKASSDAQVEVLSGAAVIGATKAESNGDFAIVIENPLKPGDYQLVLRQTLPNGTSATSVETATVSVPEQVNGEVLALVEQPGKPSRIITAPKSADVAMETQVVAPAAAAQDTPSADPAKPADTAVAVATTEPAAPAQPEAPAPAPVTAGNVNIEAVETEDGKIFIAGSAKGVKSVRVYANDTILGESSSLRGDRFLVEAQKDLTAGDYIIKAEGLGSDGVTVISRSIVPFKAAVENQVAAAASAAGEQGTAAATAQSDVAISDKKPAVIIRRGDTLWQISRRVYGRGVRYSTIYLANKDAIEDPNMIFPGQVMAIPDATPEGESANAEEIKKRETAE